MDKYSKALKQMRREGIDAYTKPNGGVFVSLNGNGKSFEIELSYSDVEKWSDLYDDGLVEEFKESDPYEILEEIARIFHYSGCRLIGDNSDLDTSFIRSSEKYLEMVYKAFNPIHKK